MHSQKIKRPFIYIILLFLCSPAISRGLPEKNVHTTDPNTFLARAKHSVRFIENKGQFADTDGKLVPFVLFKTGVPGIDLYVTTTGLSYMFSQEEKKGDFQNGKTPDPFSENTVIHWEKVDMILEGASIKKENVIVEGPSQNSFHYFYAHCPKGIRDVKAYEKITIKNIYPGIDWILYNKAKEGFKYDFIVHPGADPGSIRLIYRSLQPLKLGPTGNLELALKRGKLTENAPYSYLLETQEQVASSFHIIDEQKKEEFIETHVLIKTGSDTNRPYDPSKTLVIDPQLFWASFFGGNHNDIVHSIDTDASGNLFITGSSTSNAFPTFNIGSSYQGSAVVFGDTEAFILKFSSAGVLLWSTQYGGSSIDVSQTIEVDPGGNIFVSGYTASNNFPLQNAGTFFQGALSGSHDGFILKFDNMGNRLWATYYGGQNVNGLIESTNCLATDGAGNLFVTGYTSAGNLPVQNAGTYFQGNLSVSANDVFLLKFDNAGNRLWATYYGPGMPTSIDIDPAGNIFVSGIVSAPGFPLQNAGSFFQGTIAGKQDLFILKFTNAGVRQWATLYGGTEDDSANGIGCDAGGNVFVVGDTRSINFPVQAGSTYFQGTRNGSMDAVVLKFDNAGNRLWATYFGGGGTNETESASDLDIDKCNNLYFSVIENSTQNVPLQTFCDGGYQANTKKGTSTDNLIVNLSGAGALLWSTYYGGNNQDDACYISLDNSDNLFTAFSLHSGPTSSNNNYPYVDPGGGAWANFNQTKIDMHISKFLGPVSATSTFTYASPYCGGSTTVLSPVKGPGFATGGLFSSGTGLTIDPSTGDVLTGSSLPGIYTITYTPLVTISCGCVASAATTNTLAIGITPTVDVNSTTLCPNSSAVLNATVTPANGNIYTWLPGGLGSTSLAISPAASTNYSLQVVTPEGCSTTAVAQVTVLPGVPPLSINASTICTGKSTTLDPQAPSGMSYSWLPGGQSSPFIVVSPASTTSYSVIISAGTCTSMVSSSVVVSETIHPVVNFSYNTPVCLNTANLKPYLSVNFSTGGTFSSTDSLSIDPLSGEIDLTHSLPGSYFVSYGIPGIACRNPGDTLVKLLLNSPPVLSLPSKIHLVPGTNTVLTVSGSSSYTWSPSEWLSCSDCSDPVASPPEDIQYCVSSASNNCLSQVCILVEVNCQSDHDFSIPNAFTPNGDNTNDIFCLQGWDVCLRQFSAIIFNRWGEKVFESTDPNFCWDGTYNGKLQNEDVFIYTVNATFLDTTKISKRGTISLIR